MQSDNVSIIAARDAGSIMHNCLRVMLGMRSDESEHHPCFTSSLLMIVVMSIISPADARDV